MNVASIVEYQFAAFWLQGVGWLGLTGCQTLNKCEKTNYKTKTYKCIKKGRVAWVRLWE
jgi:hypothetical protein